LFYNGDTGLVQCCYAAYVPKYCTDSDYQIVSVSAFEPQNDNPSETCAYANVRVFRGGGVKINLNLLTFAQQNTLSAELPANTGMKRTGPILCHIPQRQQRPHLFC